MSEQEAYDRLIAEILALPNNNLRYSHMPVEDKVIEAHKTLKLGKEDKEKLLHSGLDPKLIDTLEDRIGAYSIANANYMLLKNSIGGLKGKEKTLEKEAYNLRRKLFHDLRFALDENEEALNVINEIAEGRSRNDLVYDFVPIIKLIEAYPEELAKINFDQSLVEKANSLHLQMQDILSKMKASPKEVSEVKSIRDKAYTYMDDALIKIRKHGQYVFWEDPERLNLYKSDFMSNLRHKRKNNVKNIEEEEMAVVTDNIID